MQRHLRPLPCLCGAARAVRAGRRPRVWRGASVLLRRTVRRAVVLMMAMFGAVATWAGQPPQALSQYLTDTGLFVAGTTRVRADNLAFYPQYPLWSDGAAKRRWIQLPPGSFIDATLPDAWVFPVGTRLWKEFSHAGRPIETRLIERLGDGQWRYATYVWNAQGTDAVLAPEWGLRNLPASSAPGGVYAVPSRADCRACHEGGASPVLGFSALQLSPARDPNAAHAEMPSSGAVLDLDRLQVLGLLRNLPATLRARAPRIAAPDPSARAALGYLHANCGHCHNDSGPLASLDMALQQNVGDAVASVARTRRDLFGRASSYQGIRSERRSEPLPAVQRLDRSKPDASMVLQRMRSAQAMQRMPPLGVSRPDEAGMALIRRWMEIEDLSQPKEKLP